MNAKSEKSKDVAVQQETRRARVAPLMRFADLDDAFEVRLSLPGVTQEGLKVEIDNTHQCWAAREGDVRRDACPPGFRVTTGSYELHEMSTRAISPAAHGCDAHQSCCANGIRVASLKVGRRFKRQPSDASRATLWRAGAFAQTLEQLLHRAVAGTTVSDLSVARSGEEHRNTKLTRI